MTENRVRFLFVYGSLKSDVHCEIGRKQRRLLQAEAEFVGPVTVRGKLFDVGPYPGAVFSDRQSERIYGELWRLPRNLTHLLEELNRYEGCAADSPLPHTYSRKRVRVRAAHVGRVTAWIYVWNGDTPLQSRIASGRWTGPPPAHASNRSSGAAILPRRGANLQQFVIDAVEKRFEAGVDDVG